MTQRVMIQLLLFTFGLATATNFVLSILGFEIIFSANDTLSYIICVVLAFTLLVLKLCMEIIFSRPRSIFFRLLRIALLFGIILDLGAVACAVVMKIIGKQSESGPITVNLIYGTLESAVVSVRIASIALIVLFVAAPLAFSYLLKELLADYEAEK